MNLNKVAFFFSRALFALLSVGTFLTIPAKGAIAIDATVSTNQSTAASSVTSPAFSTTSSNDLLLAFISTDYLSGANTTVTGVTGAGLTWTLVVRTNAQSGSSEIWRAFASTTLSGVAVKASLSQSVVSSITVMSFSGVDTSGTGGSGAIGATKSASAKTGAPTTTLTTTQNGSWVFGVGNDFDNAIARTIGSGQTLVHQYLTPTGDTYWVQMESVPTPLSGTSVTINDTAPTTDRYNLSICEVLPAAGSAPTYSLSGTISPTAGGSGASVALSGSATQTVTADSSGSYTFSNLLSGSYTVTPSNSGYSFNPASQQVTITSSNATGINFTATPNTWTISGVISPAAAGSAATVALSGTSTATTTADNSGNYSFSNLANGTYSVTPSKAGYSFTPPTQSVTVNGANPASVNFTGQASSGAGTSALAIDAAVSADGATATSTLTTTAFSTTASNELLLAFISTDYLTGANTTVTGISGAGLTWTLVLRTNAQSGSSEIWRAFAPAVLTDVTATATLSQKVVASMTILGFTGVDTTGSNGSGAIGATKGASAKSGAPTASLATTRNNSWVFGVGNDFDNAIARTVGSGQSLVHQYLTPTGDTYWVQMQNGTTATAGTTVTINDTDPTGDRYNLSIVEVLPALLSSTGTPPVVSMTSPAANGTVTSKTTVAANAMSSSYAITGVQFLLDGTNLSAEVTAPPYSITWDTTTVTAGTHTLSAIAYDSANLSTTATPITVTVDNSGNTAIVGSWSSPVTLPAVAVNLILLKDGTILFYQDGSTPTIWNYSANTFTTAPAPADLFCSGQAMLADGRILAVGGYGGSSSKIGIANAEIFDVTNDSWTVVPPMAYSRWYPTATTLSDGRILVTAGWQTTNHSNAGIPEIYDPSANAWTQLTNANNPFETYPFMFLLSDGSIIHTGGSEYATDTDVLDINAQTWTVLDSRTIDGGSATMYSPGKILKAGSASDSQNTGPSSNTAFVLDTTQAAPAWQQTPSMAYPRSFMNLTTLPDGTVLATGGETDKNGGNISNAVYAAELWSPATQTWTTMASMHTPREYHSTALLLPDGRVLQSGMGADFGNVPDELSAEFYSPPYLFKGARPTITQAPTSVSYGSSFFVATPDATTITSAVMIRTGAVTHFFDQNTRFVPVTFSQTTGGLNITAPANGFAAPPGFYMLFLVNSNGVPSVAPILQLTP